MINIRWLAVLVILPLLSARQTFAQSKDGAADIKTLPYEKQGGNFSVGIRNTVNLFSDEPKSFGTGAGGSFRIQLVDRVNTEWFADIISTNLYNRAHRLDAHIGWNVMFYLLNPKGFTRKFTPYVAAGHCFDYTSIRLNGEDQANHVRWTAAVQMSVGCHYNITPKFDISVATMYVLHLGKELDADQQPDGSVMIEEHKNAGWEGHVMLIVSAHYKFLKLWKPRK
ncbi:MAG: hypothetical protein JWO06_1789 [Bacteroidota bacterium]|nr:hypothetical protein [Bacteroidota bacterium]